MRDAIVKCRDRATAIAKGVDKKGKDVDPRPARTRRLQDGDRPAGETVSGLLDKFIERYAKKEAKLRSADQIEDTFERLVKPSIGKIGIYALRRKDVGDMLDEIADESGPVMADRTLAYVRKAFNWWMVKDENFKCQSSRVWQKPTRRSVGENAFWPTTRSGTFGPASLLSRIPPAMHLLSNRYC